MLITIQPCVLAVGKKPLGSGDGKTVKCKTHCFADTDEAIERANFGQHMSGIRPLVPTCGSAILAL